MFCCIDFGSTVMYNITLERSCIHIVKIDGNEAFIVHSFNTNFALSNPGLS